MPQLSEQADSEAARSVPTRRHSIQVVWVGLRVCLLGAMAGALAGAIGVATWVGIFAGEFFGALPGAIVVAGTIGAVLGSILLPLAGFTVLRRMPLWRIVAGAMAGTIIGGLVGAQYLTIWILGPVVGFASAIVLLWRSARRLQEK